MNRQLPLWATGAQCCWDPLSNCGPIWPHGARARNEEAGMRLERWAGAKSHRAGEVTGRVWGSVLGGNGEPLKVLKQVRDML